jgi:hypothetical protein
MEYKFKFFLPLYFAVIQFVYFAYSLTWWPLEPRVRKGLLWGSCFSLLFFVVMFARIGWLPPVPEFIVVLVMYMLTGSVPYRIMWSIWKEHEGSHHWLGVINFSWLFIMGLAISLFILFYREGILERPLPLLGLSKDYYQSVIQQCNFFLNALTNSVSLLGAGLGVCMAILWGGEWRRQKEEYRDHIKSSIKIIFAFFSIVFAAIIWGVLPLHQQIVALQEMLK